MTRRFWIWKSNLTEVLTAISDETDIEFKESTLDEIKFGLGETSDEKGKWLDYQIGNIALRLSIDSDDNDIVHFQIAGLDDKEIDKIEALGTNPNK